jgi:hypothetical protein
MGLIRCFSNFPYVRAIYPNPKQALARTLSSGCSDKRIHISCAYFQLGKVSPNARDKMQSSSIDPQVSNFSTSSHLVKIGSG